eukprot:gene20630-24780_t
MVSMVDLLKKDGPATTTSTHASNNNSAVPTQHQSIMSQAKSTIQKISSRKMNNNRKESKLQTAAAPLPSNIHNLDWESAISIERQSQKNSKHNHSNFTYVTFRKMVDDKEQLTQVILKTSVNIAQDVFASVLATICQLPLPLMRLLEHSAPEYSAMSSALNRLSIGNPSLNHYIRRELKKKFFLVIESAEGKSLADINIKDYLSGGLGEKKLDQLGQIMAFDLLCNNRDRFQLLSDSTDSNVMSLVANNGDSANGWHFTLMDVHINFIVNSSFTVGYYKHINRLKSLLYALNSNLYTESSQIRRMRTNINKQYNTHLTESTGLIIQHGLLLGIQSIVDHLTPEILRQTKDKVKKMIQVDHDGIWKRGIDVITPFKHKLKLLWCICDRKV